MTEDNFSGSTDERRVIRGLMVLVVAFVLVMTLIVLWVTTSLIRNKIDGSGQNVPTSPPATGPPLSPSASPTAALEASPTATLEASPMAPLEATPTLMLVDATWTPAPKGRYVRFLYWFVKPNRIKAGECVQITWETEYAVSLKLYRNDELILDNAPPQKTLQECIDEPGYTVYRMVAENSAGEINWIQLQVKVDEAP